MDNLTNSSLQKYVLNSNDCLEFKLIRSANDLEDDSTSFKPEMSHQIYGESEQIFGYCGLKIKLYYTACRLSTYLSFIYDDKVNPSTCDDVQADEIIKPIAERIPPGYFFNSDDLIRSLDKEASFKPFGQLKHKFHIDSDSGEREFQVFYCDLDVPGFNEFHSRLQTFILWYIDAASYIDTDDDRWKFFLLYEKFNSNGLFHYAIAGFTTVYQYYAYPSLVRPRISQMLVLPPFQRMGLGTELLDSVYKYYITNDNVLDITVEDPSDNFTRLRDFVDCRNCMSLKSFQPSILKEGYVEDMYREANAKFKLNKRQIRKVYEILRLFYTNQLDATEYKKYRLDVKNRLNSQYRKEDLDLKKLKKVLKPEEFAAAMNITSTEQRIENLERTYKEIVEYYNEIICRLQDSI